MMESIESMHMQLKDHEDPARIGNCLLSILTEGILMLPHSSRSTWLKIILDTTIPCIFSKQIFLMEAIPEVLQISPFDSVQMALCQFTDEELTQFFTVKQHPKMVSQIRFMHTLGCASRSMNLNLILTLADELPVHRQHLVDDVWIRLLFSGQLVNFIETLKLN